MKIATYATHPSHYFEILLESARRNHYEVMVLGMGNTWHGLMDKFFYTCQSIDTLPDDEIIVFMDAFDTLVLRPDCIDAFLRIHEEGKVLFSACPSDPILDFLFGAPRDIGVHYNSINTGLYMGYVADLKCLFAKFQTYMVQGQNDQRAMNQYYRENGDHIQLDGNSEIFYNLEWETPFPYLTWFLGIPYQAPLSSRYYTTTDQGILVAKTHQQPFFLQANMNADMDKIVRSLGLTLSKKNKNHQYYLYSTATYIWYGIQKLFEKLKIR